MPAANVTVSAEFEEIPVTNYTVTLNAGEGAFAEAGEAITSLTVADGAKISTATELASGSLPTPTKADYVFIGWKKGATDDIISADDLDDEVVTADITYTAQYDAILSPRVPQNVAKLTTIDTDSTGADSVATLVGNRYVYEVPTAGIQPGLNAMTLASDNVYYDFDFMLPTDGLTLYTMFGDSKGGNLNYQIAQLEIKSANGKVNLTHTWSGSNSSQKEQPFEFDAETELLTNTWYRAVIKTTAAGNTTKASGATITIYAVNHDGTVGDKIKSAPYKSLRTLNSGTVVNKLNLSSANTEAHPYVDNMFTYTDPSYDVTVTVTSDEGAVNGAKITANDLVETNQTAAEDSNQVTLNLKAGTWTLTPEAAGFDAPETPVTVTVPDETTKTITMTKKRVKQQVCKFSFRLMEQAKVL
ncbi:MAG: InlB B-repeat-containing protein [Clostridia bacterium]|nr:InlB B-repeat-containing protein [Clostridia bacterium]